MSARTYSWLGAAGLVAALALACKGNNSATGSEGANCYPNGTCDQDLLCLSDLCVSLPDAAPTATLGQLCSANGDCVSGVCLDDIGRCSQTCTGASGCPQFENWECAPLGDTGDVCQCEPMPAEACSAALLDCDCDTEDDGLDDCALFSQSLAPVDDVDILFVVDNSGSMSEEQTSLTNNFHRFIDALEIGGHLPGLHIGVVSTDVGAGPFNISGCSGNGDNGVLQNTPRSGCDPPSGQFIRDVPDGVGGRDTNYIGTLSDTFACIATLGIAGCGFEQPLESMRRALDGTNPQNDGFLRPGAALAVVIITDEDDCSAFDTNMYDTSQNSISDPLGPLLSFRCFEFGVVCEPDTPRTPGPRQNCVPRDDSAYMYRVDQFATFLKELKGDASLVMVAGIIGNATPVTVGVDDMSNPELEPSCVSASGEADPAVRIDHLLDQFPGRSTVTTICNEDLSDALVTIGGLLAAGVGGPCLWAMPLDVDYTTAGLQTDCSVADVQGFGTDAETVMQLIPKCTAESPPQPSPCWHLEENPSECPGTAHHLRAVVERGDTNPPAGTLPIIRCSETQ